MVKIKNQQLAFLVWNPREEYTNQNQMFYLIYVLALTFNMIVIINATC